MKKKTVFIDGEITPEFIAEAIRKHQVKTQIGGHNIFLGQVRADEVNGRQVSGAMMCIAFQAIISPWANGASAPPTSMTSAPPVRSQFMPSTIACADDAHALDTT